AAVVAGAVVGFVAGSVVDVLGDRPLSQEEIDRLYEDYRALWWAVAKGFRPDGYRLIEDPELPMRPLDSHTCSVPNVWYGPSKEHDMVLALGGNAWKTTQRSLGWVNDEKGYAMVVHMVFTTFDLGRGPLARPEGNSLRDFNSFRAEYHFVGTRDNIIYFFQMLPLPDSKAGTTHYSLEWLGDCRNFIDEFRQFVDNPPPELLLECRKYIDEYGQYVGLTGSG
ncbi:MAG: hypothetical protein K6U08_04060, partial [Firmicutes bacterium]|nr:hypothetical protein [Bacillota bacterium]